MGHQADEHHHEPLFGELWQRRRMHMEIRNYAPEMIYRYHKFLNQARSDRPDYEETTVEAIHAFFTPPYYDSRGHFLALVEDEIVADVLGSRNLGYMVFPEDRINFSLNVLPEHRRKGIGRKLLRTTIDFFKEKGMKVAIIDDVHSKCNGAMKFYKKLGFKKAASSYWMQCKLSEMKSANLERRAPKGYQIRSLSDRDELEAFRSTVNEAFSDTQGFTPVDKEQFKQRYVDRPTFDLGGFLVAVEEGSNSIVGTAASLIEIDNTKKETFGHIKAVGVTEHHRGKGLARHLMLESMKWLASHGMLVARLGTNNNHAFRLYRSLGFNTLHEYSRFEKAYA